MDPTQASLMQERVILVDKDDNVLGPASKIDTHATAKGPLLHRAFSVFLFDRDGLLLLQQRAAAKVTFPLFWANTCCSHPLYCTEELGWDSQPARPVEGAKRAAVRKLQHELGLSLKGGDTVMTYLTRLHYCAESPTDPQWGEHEIDYILIAQDDRPFADISFVPNSNEVEAVRWVDQPAMRDMARQCEEGQLLITPWCKLIIDKFLYPWWDSLSDLSPHMDPMTIYRLGANADMLATWQSPPAAMPMPPAPPANQLFKAEA
ncbi:unnamed protein product [Vitrella brassicaformis CCMP3155]|uniref:isopentenyl-diphosphate Delta-isomerase n=1 Tax=Vitrella brassicaformis (strain CCMP3155) TaxID=1169540 RepID=A0A0G4ESY9_VITBC|nr:unnamed protein product [Vitrella brassicaformis CCMP3155]|eukprot:CEM00826.1 unnamed protein product [Vitrella brassicaformis CCMP3155]